MNQYNLNARLYLRESKLSNTYELFHKFAENLIFFRWTFFKNRPRTTFLLIRSFLLNTLIFGLYYTVFSKIKFLFMGIDVDPVLLYAAGIIVGYWNMQLNFGQKSQYVSTLYNDIIKEQGRGNYHTANMLSINFATQLLVMDLWGHRLFSWLFTESLETGAKWCFQTKNSAVGPYKSFEEFMKSANAGKLRVVEARNILLTYQKHLAQFRHDKDNNSAA